MARLLEVARDSISAVPKESGHSRKVKQEVVDNVSGNNFNKTLIDYVALNVTVLNATKRQAKGEE
jgi:hypothetical protein